MFDDDDCDIRSSMLGFSAVVLVILALVVSSVFLSGCGGITQYDRPSSITAWAIGLPGVAIIKQSEVTPANTASGSNEAEEQQKVVVPVSLTK